MCKYCDKKGKDSLAVSVVVTKHSEKDTKGIRLSMHGNNHTLIVDGVAKYAGAEYDDEGKELSPPKTTKYINYLEITEWDQYANRHQNLAVEIKYCPFCGQEL